MLKKKQGYPIVDELLLCSVTKIHHHSVFVSIDEYARSGMIHISEISPGRIRNIRDFVAEGKVVVCKVLRIDKERGHIDLSLRRVNESQRRQKVDEIKQEQIVEKMIGFVAKQIKRDVGQLFDEVAEKITKKYESMYSCFEDVVAGEIKLEDFIDDKDVLKSLQEVIIQRIKPKEVEITGNYFIKTYASDGVEIVKEALAKVLEKSNDQARINYIGAGKYKATIKAGEYKEAEGILQNMTKAALKFCQKKDAQCEFIRAE